MMNCKKMLLPNNIAEDFYNPVMKKAISFDRISGFFSSKALALYSEGLEHFLKEKCRYRLIVSKEISELDYNEIKLGYQIKRNILEYTRINK